MTCLFRIKPLDWRRTSFRRVTNSRTARTSETWKAATGILDTAEYRVWQAVGGRCFVEVPRIAATKDGGGFLTYGRKPVASIEAGKAYCQADWNARIAKHLEAIGGTV
jgi:hypothetical protein